MLLFNGHVLTQDPCHSTAVGVLLEGESVAEVLYDEQAVSVAKGRIAPERWLDLNGATILPGLVDGHFHLQYLGAIATQIDLTTMRSAEEVLNAVKQAAQSRPAGSWIKGRGWDENRWSGILRGKPHRKWLDEVSQVHPIWLERVDGHAGWCNSLALKSAGIVASSSAPMGGEIVRGADGEPTGVLVDNAMELVRGTMPKPSRAQTRLELQQGMQRCVAAGLTGIHDMGTEAHVLEVLKEMDAEGELLLRITCYLYGDDDYLQEALRAPPWRGNRLQVVGVKLFVDGALGSHGAAMIAPYLDRPDSSGLLMDTPERLQHRVLQAHRAGYQVAMHAIGDRGNRLALSFFEAARQEGGENPYRHRVEHAQVVDPDDFLRFKQAGCIASVQPIHAITDMAWVEQRISARAMEGAYAWRRFIQAGVPMVLGSDAPVEPENPWLGIHAAVTRQAPGQELTEGWRMEQCLSVQEALQGFTKWPAAAVGEAGGVISAGMRADLTVVDRSPLLCPPHELWQIRTLGTFVGGGRVFSLDSASD